MQVVWCDEDEKCPRLLALRVETHRLDEENSRCHDQLLSARLRSAEQQKLIDNLESTVRTQQRTIRNLRDEADRTRERLKHTHDQ